MPNIMGIDTGLQGGIAIYDGTELLVWDMPTYAVESSSGKTARHIDIVKLQSILRGHGLIHTDHVYLEQAWPRPQGGVSTSFKCGVVFGETKATIQCAGLPFTVIPPQVWKKKLSVPANKDAARMRASQLLPQWAHSWSLKRQDGVAEAALIAYYGFHHR